MPFRILYKNIFDKNESDAGGSDMLLDLVKKYPYFSIAHFFLLKQTGIEDSAYNHIAANTALHFNNPFLLQEQLHLTLHTAAINDTKEEEPATEMEANNEAASIASHPAADIEDAALNPVIKEAGIGKVENAAAATVHTGVQSNPTSTESVKEKELVENEEEPMVFEPLYSTDYFASQGIKLREEAQPTDKLGKQLKSFTDWLKTMKKVHESKLPDGSETLDATVQVLAEKSNMEQDVLTETMAEVYLQQGKRNKAKEIYEKLSLLSPAKNAYFAAKIDQIQ